MTEHNHYSRLNKAIQVARRKFNNTSKTGKASARQARPEAGDA